MMLNNSFLLTALAYFLLWCIFVTIVILHKLLTCNKDIIASIRNYRKAIDDYNSGKIEQIPENNPYVIKTFRYDSKNKKYIISTRISSQTLKYIFNFSTFT